MPRLLAKGLSLEEFEASKKLFDEARLKHDRNAADSTDNPLSDDLSPPPAAPPTLRRYATDPTANHTVSIPTRAVPLRSVSETKVASKLILSANVSTATAGPASQLLAKIPSVLPKLNRLMSSSSDKRKFEFYCQICLSHEETGKGHGVDPCGHTFCKEVFILST